MKNFKKVLALVLVVVMAMSFATVSSAAFTDAESIEKAEAVDVLSAIGVINGYADGSFKPEGNVTRAEMAKMIATILNKGEDVGAMYAGACTFTDAANHWAAGYIAYCAQEGIINGKNATTFDPEANVTGTEAAKMVLGALGYKADKAGLTGSAWASTTLSLAKKALLIGEQYDMTANMSQPLNRENAAQLLLNGLKATMVSYESDGLNINLDGIGTITQGATFTAVAGTEGADMDAAYDADAKGVVEDDYYQQLAEECFPDLSVETEEVDAFGRACKVWSNGTETIGTYAVAPTLTYTTAITMGQLYTDLGKVRNADLADGGLTYYVDGKATTEGTTYTYLTTKLASGRLEEIGAQGMTTEVYYDAQEKTLRVCQSNVYAAKIENVVPAETDANGDVSEPAYIEIAPLYAYETVPASAQYKADGTQLDDANYVLTDAFTEADIEAVVYYTIGADVEADTYQAQIQTVAKATAVTGKNGGFAGPDEDTIVNTTVGGTTYNVNVTAQGEDKYEATYGADETIYLDANNNVIYTTAVASNDYLLVLGYENEGKFDVPVHTAMVVLSDGTTKIVELTDAVDDEKAVFNYVVGTDGKYTLIELDSADSSANGVTNKTPTLVADNAETEEVDETVYADTNTIFVVGIVDDTTDATTYTAYTGISKVPSFTGTVYYATNASGNATVVFCTDADLTAATTAASMVLYKTGNEARKNGAYGVYYTVAAVIDGQVTTVDLTATAYGDWTGFRVIASAQTEPSSGYYKSLTDVDEDQTETFEDFVAYKNGNITLGTKMYVDDSVPVVVWNQSAAKLQVKTVTGVRAMAAETTGVYTVDVDGNVSGIYMTVEY